jgi:hypothetical protein
MLRIEVHRLFCYGGHFEYKMASKIQKSSDLAMIHINSQHHNLLGNQISSKSEDLFILAAILDSKWPS